MVCVEDALEILENLLILALPLKVLINCFHITRRLFTTELFALGDKNPHERHLTNKLKIVEGVFNGSLTCYIEISNGICGLASFQDFYF